MIKDAIEKLESMFNAAQEPKKLTHDGVHYHVDYLGGLHRLRPKEHYDAEIMPDVMAFNTLEAFSDFVDTNIAKVENSGFIVVVSPIDVRWMSDIIPHSGKKRYNYAKATTPPHKFIFGDVNDVQSSGAWYELINFVIALQSQFVVSDEVKSIITYLSNVHNEKIVEIRDDSFTQALHIKTGITTKGNVKIENPVTLAPYRTFNEVDQPESDFILRFRESEKKVECALFEADAGAWKLKAMQNVAQKLDDMIESQDVQILV